MPENNFISQIMASLGINTIPAITSLEQLQKAALDTNVSLNTLAATNARVAASFAGNMNAGLTRSSVLVSDYFRNTENRARNHATTMSRVLNPNIFLHHAGWLLTGATIFEVLSTMKDGLVSVETGMKGLQTVLPTVAHDQEAYNRALQESLQIMTDYGASVEEIFSASRSFARMYKDQDLVLQLVDNATKLQIVDNMKLEESVKANEASLATWGKELKNSNEVLAFSSHLMDAYTALSHNAFAPASDLANATSRAAAAAKQAGIDMDHFLGLTASGLRAIQRPGGEVGKRIAA